MRKRKMTDEQHKQLECLFAWAQFYQKERRTKEYEDVQREIDNFNR